MAVGAIGLLSLSLVLGTWRRKVARVASGVVLRQFA